MTKKEMIEAIDKGIRDSHILRKHIMTGFSRDIGNQRLNSTHYRTLVHLSHAGPSCMHDAGHAAGLEAGSFTPVADRLIEEGLAARMSDPEDRRRSLLALTPAGKDYVLEIKARVLERFEEKLSVIGDEHLAELAGAMQAVSRARRVLEEADNE